MGTNKTPLKKNFEIQTKLEAFYSGGKVQLSEDGSHLFCCCGHKVTVLQVETGKVVHSFGKEEEEDEVTSFALSPDDRLLVITGQKLLIRQWEWQTETLVRTWKSLHLRPIKCMSFDGTSTLLATGGSDSALKVWDIVRQYCTHNLKGVSGVFSTCLFHPKGEVLLGAADDFAIHVWRLSDSRSIATLNGHFSPVTKMDFSQDCKIMISCGRDKVVLVWNMLDFTLKSTIPTFESLESIFFLPEGATYPQLNVKNVDDLHFVTAGVKGQLRIFNIKSGNVVYEQINSPVEARNHGDEDELEIARINQSWFNRSLNSVVMVTHDHDILFFKMADMSLWKQYCGYNDQILDLCFLGDGDSHVAVATNSANIKVFKFESFNCQLLQGHSDIVMSVRSFPRQPNRMVSCSKDNSIRLWELNEETGFLNCLFVGSGHTQSVNAVACSNLNGDFVLSGGQDTTLKLWDVPSKVNLVLAVPSLVSKATEKAHDKEINAIAVAPNDKLCATSSHDKTAKVWRMDTLELYGTLRGHRKGVWSVQFSNVDQVVATSSADGTVKIWALSNFACLKTFEGHDSSVLNVVFLTRGMQLLTTASDGNLKLWTVKENECVQTKEGHEDKVWALAVSKNEEIFVTGGGDSTIIVWKDTTEIEKEEAQNKMDELIIQEQRISNLMAKGQWVKALRLAIQLEQPFRALTLIKEIMIEGSDIQNLIDKLRDDQIMSLLKFSIAWNTNSKHCAAAQMVLRAVFQRYTPEELMKFPVIKEYLEGLLPYTHRHFHRMNRLQMQATFVDYMWQTMTLAEPMVSEKSIKMLTNESEDDVAMSSGEE